MRNKQLLNRIKLGILKWAIIALLLITLVMIIYNSLKNYTPKDNSERLLLSPFRETITRQMAVNYMPLFSFLEEHEQTVGLTAYMESAFNKQIPLLYLSEQELRKEPAIEDEQTRDILIKQEGRDEDVKNISESELDYNEDALHIEENVLQSFLTENIIPHDEITDETAGIEIPRNAFIAPAFPAYTYDWSQEFTFDQLINNFYAIDKTTAVTEARINLKNLLYRDLTIKKNVEGPQILIYHTHSLEAFADSVPGDPSMTIVGAGERLAEILRTDYGYNVLHHTVGYDVEGRDYAYTKALPEIERLLIENPSIQVIIDLHRDEMKDGKKLLMDIQGRPTARFMFFNGLSYSKQTGAIEYLENPHINENLAFSFQAQVKTNEYYPGLARKIYLKTYRYNMHLLPRTTLIELGAQTNTFEEIINACDPLAHVISLVIK
ncbi:MAG: stage II sporulation protein P [Lachnospiraceae bacterium]|nr:stage II sporulation protein P [Lachnospiraceae bacterium]